MVKLFTTILICWLSYSVLSQEPEVFTFETFESCLNHSNDTTYVVNFWATWCKPCIEEIPLFEEINDRMQASPVKIILVSLDFRNQIQSKLIPFLRERKLHSEIVVLDAPNANAWIDKVDPSWSGAIPATLIYKNESRSFYEKQFEDISELESIIHSFLNAN